ncbi:hypothetical protein FXV91_03335 [Methanosarcina sp. DH2]|uniref:hypothetical protein n=1 Tax=Methanosarcina sp. DH2 TaxID=2605639 RepID=UPI001E365765|nr:hypothetical protein [Methanosarcina sp. DH2]MCC4769270.1 hypothetical protein [Methanosarcina sp. DH2]
MWRYPQTGYNNQCLPDSVHQSHNNLVCKPVWDSENYDEDREDCDNGMGDKVFRSGRINRDVGKRQKKNPKEYSPVIGVIVRKFSKAFEEQNCVRSKSKSKR